MKENKVLRDVMLLSRGPARLLRNNCGQFRTEDGRYIRYGVGNPGGSDLIGWVSVTITPDMVGQTVAIFTAVETKAPGKHPSKEQVQFISAVQKAGGIAGIARSQEDAIKLLTARNSNDTVPIDDQGMPSCEQ